MVSCVAVYQNQEEVGAGLAAAVEKGYVSLDKVCRQKPENVAFNRLPAVAFHRGFWNSYLNWETRVGAGKQVWITSKIWNIDHRPEAVRPAALVRSLHHPYTCAYHRMIDLNLPLSIHVRMHRDCTEKRLRLFGGMFRGVQRILRELNVPRLQHLIIHWPVREPDMNTSRQKHTIPVVEAT